MKFGFAGMLFLVLLPFAGAALNGFSYPANRWIWAFAMLAGYITAVMVPALTKISFKKGVVLLVCLVVYGAICLAFGSSGSTYAEIFLGIAVVLAMIGLHAAEEKQVKEKNPAEAEEKTSAGTVSADRKSRKSGSNQRGSVLRPAQSCVLIGAILLTEAIHGYVEFIPGRMNSSIAEYHSRQYIEAMKASDAAGIRKLIGNDTFYRYSGRDLANNFSILHDVSNTQFYWSLSDSGIEQFFTETGQGNGMVHLYDNLDNRTFPDEIAAVRYYIRSDGSLLPFGYEKCEGFHYDNRELFTEKEGDPLPVFSFSVYENHYALPLGFTTSKFISGETYESLSIPQRQEALMQGVVLEPEDIQEQNIADLELHELFVAGGSMSASDENMDALDGNTDAAGGNMDTAGEKTYAADENIDAAEEKTEALDEHTNAAEGNSGVGKLVFTSEEIPFEFSAEGGIEVGRGSDGSVKIVVRDPEAALSLKTGNISRREVSVLFTGTDYAAPEEGYRDDETYTITTPVTIRVKAKKGDETVSVKKIEYTLEDNPWKTGRRDFLSCCGYSEEALTGLKLDFSRRGTYTFKELKVIGQPMEDYPAQAEALRECVLENLDLHEPENSGATSRITGTVTLPECRILCIQIPRCSGLRAYVDGEEQPLLKADTMFSALALEAGSHEIELRYTTPGLIPGVLISAAAILLFFAETVVMAARRRLRG